MKLLYKRSFTLLLLLATAYCLPLMAQTAGGPDEFGYTWKDSNDPEGPTFEWVDITELGTEVEGLADDNSVNFVDMGMEFQFYWNSYNQIKLGSNSWVSF